MKYITILFALAVIFSGCKTSEKPTTEEDVTTGAVAASFDTTIDGKQVALYTLKNSNGMSVSITNYGARIVSIFAPDKNGEFADVAMGYATIGEYLTDKIYLGGIVGRYANRINKGKFTLNDVEYTLALNDGPNTLHGGDKGTDRVVWDAAQEGNKLTLTYQSADMEEGYPGVLDIEVVYVLSDNNELSVVYEAETDKPTVVNLTSHAYFNLKGDGSETILDHEMQIFADHITPVDETLIPTGELTPVEGTPFDFREPKTIGKDISVEDTQLAYGQGYDHNWVLAKEGDDLTVAVRVSEPTSGRVLELLTTEPAVQFYSGNFLDGTIAGKYGKKYKYRSGIAIEPQHYPDSPNHENFPSTVLNPGEKYTQKSVFKFSVQE